MSKSILSIAVIALALGLAAPAFAHGTTVVFNHSSAVAGGAAHGVAVGFGGFTFTDSSTVAGSNSHGSFATNQSVGVASVRDGVAASNAVSGAAASDTSVTVSGQGYGE